MSPPRSVSAPSRSPPVRPQAASAGASSSSSRWALPRASRIAAPGPARSASWVVRSRGRRSACVWIGSRRPRDCRRCRALESRIRRSAHRRDRPRPAADRPSGAPGRRAADAPIGSCGRLVSGIVAGHALMELHGSTGVPAGLTGRMPRSTYHRASNQWQALSLGWSHGTYPYLRSSACPSGESGVQS